MKKLPVEEYNKFIEEAKKSLYAINKIITFAGRILQSAFTIGQFDDRMWIYEFHWSYPSIYS